MKRLLELFRERATTLTVFNYDGSRERLDALRARLAGRGILLRTERSDRGTPSNLAVFHRGDDVLRAVGLSDLLAGGDTDYGTLLGEGDRGPLPELPVDGSPMSLSPEADRERMVRISRDIERRALREGEGRLCAGFQDISALRSSERTVSVYERLATAGVDVTVVGYPDASLADPPFDVVEDEAGRFQDYWFLLYDGGDNSDRRGVLVSRETGEATYESFWTVDPETVDEALAVAAEHYPELGLASG